jgi:AraC-like DNA-binding protein
MVSSSEFSAVVNAVAAIFGQPAVARVFRRHSFSERILTDPSLQVSNAEYMRFLEAAARETKQPLLGAMLGDGVPFAELGLYGRYVSSAATLKEALERASRTLRYHETGSWLAFTLEGSKLRLTYSPPTPRALGSWHQSDGVAAMLINLVRLFEGPGWTPERLGLAAATGDRFVRLQTFFGVRIVSLREGTELVGQVGLNAPFKAAISEICPPISWSELRTMVAERPPQSFSGTLTQLMETLILDGRFELGEISDSLGISPRTIQRHLQEEGTRFGEVLRAVRQARAEALLLKTQIIVSEIAVQLGYSSKSQFIRAFKCWRGVAPGAFRASHRLEDY